MCRQTFLNWISRNFMKIVNSKSVMYWIFFFIFRDEDIMTFQSKEPIISIQMDDKLAKEKSGGGGGHHGITVEHPTS